MPGIGTRIKVLVKLKAATRIARFIIEPKRKRSNDYIAFGNDAFLQKRKKSAAEIYFTVLQLIEHHQAPFTSTICYSQILSAVLLFLWLDWFPRTIIIGTLFLLISLIRIISLYLSKNHHHF